MSKIVLVASGKGGVGKTTIASNLGRCLASQSLSVLLVDGDFGLNNLDVVLEVEEEVRFDLFDAINGKCRIKQALVKDKKEQTLYLLPSNKFYENESVNSMQIKSIITSLSKKFDVVIIDAPAGVEAGLLRILPCALEGIVVLTSDPSSLRDADKVVSQMKAYGLTKVGVVVNRVRGDLILDKKSLSPEEVASLLQQELIGVIPESDALLTNHFDNRKSVQVSKAFVYLAKAIRGESVQVIDSTKKFRGFFGSIKRSLRGE